VLITAAVADDVPADWQARQIRISVAEDDTGRVSELNGGDA